MSWLWATAARTGPVALASTMDVGLIAFVNGGSESELWGRAYPAVPGAERIAAAEFIATAHASVAGIKSGAALAVIGDGLLADLIRGVLPGVPSTEPDIVIDTTGAPEQIRRAVATLPRLGHLILAAPPRTADIDLATYRDLHVRALTVTGVPWIASPVEGIVGDGAVNAALESLAHIARSGPAHESAWYAVQGGGPK